jgi:hypothetical protein
VATEFKVVFEGDLSKEVADAVNKAIQKSVLGVLGDFPNPDDVIPRGPGGPVEYNVLAFRQRLRGIIFRPAALEGLEE